MKPNKSAIKVKNLPDTFLFGEQSPIRFESTSHDYFDRRECMFMYAMCLVGNRTVAYVIVVQSEYNTIKVFGKSNQQITEVILYLFNQVRSNCFLYLNRKRIPAFEFPLFEFSFLPVDFNLETERRKQYLRSLLGTLPRIRNMSRNFQRVYVFTHFNNYTVKTISSFLRIPIWKVSRYREEALRLWSGFPEMQNEV